MRILAVCFSPAKGAIADSFSALVNEISNKNDVTVISPHLSGLVQSCVHHIIVQYEASRPLHFFRPQGIGRVFQLLKNEPYEAVFWYSTNIANIVILPFVRASRHYLWCHEPQPKNRTTPTKRVLYKLNDGILAIKATKIIVAGESVRRLCPREWSHKLEVCPIASLENFDDVEVSNNHDLIDLSKKEKKVFRIVFFGVLELYKGLNTLAIAVRKLLEQKSDIKFELEVLGAGDLEKFPDLILLRKNFSENVTIDNRYVPEESIYHSVKYADVAVFPYFTASGTNVLNIAFGLSCLVIASDVGNFRDHIRDGQNGFLVPPGDVDLLAQRLVGCAGDPALCEAVAKRGRLFFEKELSTKVLGDRLLNIFRA